MRGGGERLLDLEKYCNYWILIKDCFYFNNKKEFEKILNEYLSFDFKSTKHKILFNPNKEEVRKFLISNLINDEEQIIKIVVSNLEPFSEFKNLFVLKEIPNKFGLLSTQNIINKNTEEEILEQEMGLSVIKSPFTLNDIGGAKPLKDYTNQLILAEKNGYKAKGIFLVGIPGTGKTFFSKMFCW